MDKVLVEVSTVKCGAVAPHQGTVKMKGVARLVVNGSGVVTAAGFLPDPPASTAVSDCTNPGSLGGACIKIASLDGGTSTRLKVDGEFVVLDSLRAKTDRQSQVKVDSVNHDVLRAE